MTTISRENLDEVQVEAFLRRFQGLAPRRRLLLVPMIAWALLLTLVSDRSIWRAFILGTIAAFSIVATVLELVRGNWRELKIRAFRSSIWGVILGPVFLAMLAVATGGFDSPMLPFVLALCFFMGTMTSTRRLLTTVTVSALVVVGLALVSSRGWIPDLMPAVFGGGAGLPQPGPLLYSKAVVYLMAIGWAALVANGLRHVFRDIVGEVLDARDEVLRDHDAHARELTALSGELAHELKNPLANVKGLAVLVGRDVQGKGAERLQVLQHEVARMEEILQSFLTFSRPLSPLNAEQVDLAELCASALELHEGMAQEREVALVLHPVGAVAITCDPRKVKQILINLVQNALEASPGGTAVEVAASSGADGAARIEVRDRGPGIPEAVRGRLFEPGATTKERGSGLGLVLARGLARQHGGELALENREGGGCTATLTLPGRPAPLAAEVAA